MSEYLATPEPPPQPEGHTDRSNSQEGYRRHRRETPIPGVEQILQMLLQLNGAVMLGLMSTKEANVIHRNLKTILEIQTKRGSREEGGPTHEALIDLCRRDPNILNVIEVFLSDEQVDWIMNEISGDSNGPV